MTCPKCGNESHNPCYCDVCGECLDYGSAAWWDLEPAELTEIMNEV